MKINSKTIFNLTLKTVKTIAFDKKKYGSKLIYIYVCKFLVHDLWDKILATTVLIKNKSSKKGAIVCEVCEMWNYFRTYARMKYFQLSNILNPVVNIEPLYTENSFRKKNVDARICKCKTAC